MHSHLEEREYDVRVSHRAGLAEERVHHLRLVEQELLSVILVVVVVARQPQTAAGLAAALSLPVQPLQVVQVPRLLLV